MIQVFSMPAIDIALRARHDKVSNEVFRNFKFCESFLYRSDRYDIYIKDSQNFAVVDRIGTFPFKVNAIDSIWPQHYTHGEFANAIKSAIERAQDPSISPNSR